ncbi:heme NO-binding domain-containing protein [Roseicyclus persicicus]|uniref:Heme NO-binding protein n=1 Tax=Roseicyclus persicicus TaxID=2650661 RepID=A0A7X6JWH9_9RHOB|nr:heme NO-binding domain-containing protein [Roseibacterium persicicum]NKX43710.1 heme NO-binding protein [Roseibacterium persicicum]
MHGMINRALQGFLTTTYGDAVWAEVRSQAGLPFADFEAMLDYPDALTMACFQAACHVLYKHPNALLEDIGTWLVTDAHLEPLRRLMRFSGPSFLDFLLSLEEMGERGRLAVPDLDMPRIEVDRIDPSSFRIRAQWTLPGIAPILMGCLRAMADDYGALAVLRLDGVEAGGECLHVQLLDAAYSQGRSFDLGRVRA